MGDVFTAFGRFWRVFKQQKLAMIACVLFGLIFVLSLLSPILANDRPLVVQYQNQWHFPIWHNPPETAFGGVFETPTHYQDVDIIRQIKQNGTMLMPPIAFGEHSLAMDIPMPHPASPNKTHWLGTDTVGRDVLARLLYGLRISLIFGLLLSLASAILGVIIGAVMGYFAGLVDLVGQRLLEIWIGLPQIFVLMILASVFTPSVAVLFGLMLLFGWITLVPMVRVHFLKSRQLPHIMMAKNFGKSSRYIMLRHILPSTLMIVISQLPFMMVANIAALTTLDFLGFGLPVGAASLGELLWQGKNNLDAPHLIVPVLCVLTLILLLLIAIGEGLRNALHR